MSYWLILYEFIVLNLSSWMNLWIFIWNMLLCITFQFQDVFYNKTTYLLFSWHLSCRWNKCDSLTYSEETRTIKNIENGEVCTELKVSFWSWVPSSVLSIPTYSIIIGALSSFEVPTEPTSNSFLEMIRQFFKLVFRNVIATERNHF